MGDGKKIFNLAGRTIGLRSLRFYVIYRKFVTVSLKNTENMCVHTTNIRKLGVVLAVLVLAGLVLADAGAAHDALTWTEWSAANSLPDTAGNYYLTNNVTFSSTWHPKDGTNLCLDGHTVTKTGRGSVIFLDSGVSFGLYDCGTAGTITGGNVVDENDGGGICVNGGIFTMAGGIISGNSANNAGGGVYVNDGTFTMTGGSITNNTSNAYGGGVFIEDNSTFTMSGSADISGNKANAYGGGVHTQGYYELKSGTVSGNSAANDGGGVYAENGTFIVSGGKITANNANRGGGVYVTGGIFTMTGGSINSNTNPGGNEVHITEAARYSIPESVESAAYIGIHDGWTQLNLKSDIDWLFQHGGKGYLNADFDGTYLQYAGYTTYLDLNGHILTGNNYDATLRVDGVLNLYDSVGTGYITADIPRSEKDGGGVKVKDGGVFNFYTGTIKDCSINGDGAGVYDNGTFTMHDGAVISNCDCDGGNNSSTKVDYEEGGGVFVVGFRSFIMYGGLIENSSAKYGGGVYVDDTSTCIMYGGTISKCTANMHGGGVFVISDPEVGYGYYYMYGGTVTDCKPDAVYTGKE